MDVIYILIPLALVVVTAMIAAFVWAVRSGEFEDLDTPPLRILTDESSATIPKTLGEDEETQ